MTAIWPFEPQIEPTETLEWLTDIIKCRSAEQRLAMRTLPRVEYDYNYLMDGATYGRAKDLARDIGADDFYLPVWQERTEVGAVAAGIDYFFIDGRKQCYKSGGKCIVFDDDLHWELCTVYAIGETLLSITGTVANNYNNAVVMPIRTVAFMQEFEGREGPHNWKQCSARFLAVSTEDLSAESGLSYDTYRSYPFVSQPVHLLDGDLGEQHGVETDTFDPKTGLIYRWPVVNWSKAISGIAWNNKTAAELYALRVWFHQMKGRQKAFWASTFSRDLLITANIGASDTQIEIADIDFATYFPSVSDFVIVTSTEYFGIHVTGVSAGDPGYQLLDISDAIGSNINAVDVLKTSRIVLSRFDTDRVEIKHSTGGISTVAMPIIEVPV